MQCSVKNAAISGFYWIFKNNKFNPLSHCPRSLYMNYVCIIWAYICKTYKNQRDKRESISVIRFRWLILLPHTSIIRNGIWEHKIHQQNHNIKQPKYIHKKQKHTPTTIQNVFNVLFYLMASAFHFIVNIYINFKRKFIWIFSIYLH